MKKVKSGFGWINPDRFLQSVEREIFGELNRTKPSWDPVDF